MAFTILVLMLTVLFFFVNLLLGWFSKTSYITTTKDGVDPALALLIAHLCYTEYSVAEIKNDLRPNTPARPPNMWSYNAPNKHIMHYNGGAVNGTFVWKM